MELCLMIEGQEGVTWPQWLDLAGACEQHGIGTLFRSDHYMNLDGQHPERGSLDAWGTLGTMVSPATFRHPSELAKLVVTADHVSGGRVELGLGAGWHEREHAAYGFPFASMRTRLDVLEEQLQIVLGTWSSGPGAPFAFTGEHYRLDALNAQPGPVQSPHPPLIMGGSAGARSAAMAALYADEYNVPFPTLEDVREKRARIERACDDAGRAMLPFSIMTGVIIGADASDLRDRAARLEQRGGFQNLIDAPPAGWIVATVDDAAEQLQTLADAGVDRVMCQQLLHDDLDVVALLGERLAPAVA
jgi:alkanesulfonate monooxygenase SsuD/methylene tetrahydromethanopterin reductase-like flavin-dependent oxidoreductase (luciferase family)